MGEAMPADFVPHAQIPELAARVTPGMLQVLRQIQRADFILNKGLDAETAESLRQLTQLGLADPGFEGDPGGPRHLWVANGNGARVLAYKTGIRGGPHYELPPAELAAWLEQKGPDRWWNVDGDLLLTGRITFPCPARNLAAELRKLARPLLVQAKVDDSAAKGQPITNDQIDAVVDRFGDTMQLIWEGEKPPWSEDRILYLCWEGATDKWLLAEDRETTALLQAEEEGQARDAARVEAWVRPG
jgi:hypothetical protein